MNEYLVRFKAKILNSQGMLVRVVGEQSVITYAPNPLKAWLNVVASEYARGRMAWDCVEMVLAGENVSESDLIGEVRYAG
ncbi:MAG: hypothetical protein ABI876_09260 [Bacteroidota bacterium]